MSQQDGNIQTIQRLYAAFQRGEIEVILDAVAPDCNWAVETTSTAAPWYGQRTGRYEVAEYFEDFGKTMEIEEFTPISIAANDSDEVLAVIRVRGRNRGTGRNVSMNTHHYFKLRDGQVCYWRGSEDTAQTIASFGGGQYA